jgi:carbonic anhydrase/acetyltransferase-like protein (isoleucine patch superfamily)
MGTTLLDGAVVEKHGMVAAGSLVRQNTRIPSDQVTFSISFAIMRRHSYVI